MAELKDIRCKIDCHDAPNLHSNMAELKAMVEAVMGGELEDLHSNMAELKAYCSCVIYPASFIYIPIWLN